MKYAYQVNHKTFYSSRIKAHKAVCEEAKKPQMLPYKETLTKLGVTVSYPNYMSIKIFKLT